MAVNPANHKASIHEDSIANRDVSASLDGILHALHKMRGAFSPRFHVPEVSALSLRNCKDEDEYSATFINLIRMRAIGRAPRCSISAGGGTSGAI